MAADPAARAVSLTIPAKPEYVVLARLALSAVCRLTALPPEVVADLKLAITEAATAFVGEGEGSSASVTISYALDRETLAVDVGAGAGRAALAEEEEELGRAIMEATVDELRYGDGSIRLVKYLARTGH